MTDHDWLQIEQAAAGCVSGTLAEWPDLWLALSRAGRNVFGSLSARGAQRLCVELVARRDLLGWLDRNWRQDRPRTKWTASTRNPWLQCRAHWLAN